MRNWTKEFPTPNQAETKWWFYGWAFGKLDPSYLERETPDLILVTCHRTNDGHTFIGNGHFLYKSEAIGVFTEFESPETPEIDELKKMADVPEA